MRKQAWKLDRKIHNFFFRSLIIIDIADASFQTTEMNSLPGVMGRLDKWFGELGGMELLDELFDDKVVVLLSIWCRWFSLDTSLVLLWLLLLVLLLFVWWWLVCLLFRLLLFVWIELLFRFDDIAKPFGINELWCGWWCIAKWLWCSNCVGIAVYFSRKATKKDEERKWFLIVIFAFCINQLNLLNSFKYPDEFNFYYSIIKLTWK